MSLLMSSYPLTYSNLFNMFNDPFDDVWKEFDCFDSMLLPSKDSKDSRKNKRLSALRNSEDAPEAKRLVNQKDENNMQLVEKSDGFAVSLDVGQFKPEEIKVNLKGRFLVVEGAQEEKTENEFSRRVFTRKWLIPEHVDLSAIKSQMSEDGHLRIEAPRKEKALVEIPIQKITDGKEHI